MKKAKNEFVKYEMPEIDSPKNWIEDMPHENGNYINACKRCGAYFIGHKRRIICKECVTIKQHDCHSKGYEVRDNVIYCRECMSPLFDVIPDMKP